MVNGIMKVARQTYRSATSGQLNKQKTGPIFYPSKLIQVCI